MTKKVYEKKNFDHLGRTCCGKPMERLSQFLLKNHKDIISITREPGFIPKVQINFKKVLQTEMICIDIRIELPNTSI